MSDKAEKTVNEFLNVGLDKVARKIGRTRQEVFERMNRGDTEFRGQVNSELAKEIRASTNNEVREAAKQLKEDK